MAQHGYLREYDEGFGGGDSERDDWRDRDDRDRRSRERGRGFMFDEDNRGRSRDRDDDRGFFSRIGDEARSWFRDDERDNRGGGPRGGFGGSNEWREGRQSFSSHPDDHYRSWRDRQMQALDQDYADYCREREQRFHQDFDSWRQNRQQSRGQQSPQPGGQNQDELLLASGEHSGVNTIPGAINEPQATTAPEAEATLGTINSENSGIGRGGRRS